MTDSIFRSLESLIEHHLATISEPGLVIVLPQRKSMEVYVSFGHKAESDEQLRRLLWLLVFDKDGEWRCRKISDPDTYIPGLRQMKAAWWETVEVEGTGEDGP